MALLLQSFLAAHEIRLFRLIVKLIWAPITGRIDDFLRSHQKKNIGGKSRMKNVGIVSFAKVKLMGMVILGCLLVAMPCLAESSMVGDTAPDFSSLSTSGRFFEL
jgi:hypothetical protein